VTHKTIIETKLIFETEISLVLWQCPYAHTHTHTDIQLHKNI